MDLFTRNIPYYHLPKYLLFLLKHPVYLILRVCVMQSIRHLSFLHTFCEALCAQHSNSCISKLIENWIHVCMNLFTRNIPYYHLLKYLLFLLKHPVYFILQACVSRMHHIVFWASLLLQHFRTLSHRRHDFRGGKNTKPKMCFLCSLQFFVWHISYS